MFAFSWKITSCFLTKHRFVSVVHQMLINRAERKLFYCYHHCQGAYLLASSPDLPFPAAPVEKPSSGDLVCPQPAHGSCWTAVSEWWRTGWAGCLGLGCCSPPSPWSRCCCRWHHRTAWCPFSPPLPTVEHLRQKRRLTERGGKGERDHGEVSRHDVNDL